MNSSSYFLKIYNKTICPVFDMYKRHCSILIRVLWRIFKTRFRTYWLSALMFVKNMCGKYCKPCSVKNGLPDSLR